MLVTMKELIQVARKEGYGLAAPNVQSEDTVRAVIEVAEELKAPMIIDVNHFVSNDFVYFGHMIVDLVKASPVPMCINLDHGNSFDEIMWAIRAGFTSVMVDRSSLPYEENVRQTAEVVRICKPLGITVEAELGHVGWGSNYAIDGVSNLTEPEQARKFIEETGVDCLAVAIGSAHGKYKGTPHIDFELLEAIVKECGDTPLVLHGGSGTGDENLAKAVRNGIQKVNLCTDLFEAGRKTLEEAFEDSNLGVYKYAPSFLKGYKEKLSHYVKLFGQDNRCSFEKKTVNPVVQEANTMI